MIDPDRVSKVSELLKRCTIRLGELSAAHADADYLRADALTRDLELDIANLTHHIYILRRNLNRG